MEAKSNPQERVYNYSTSCFFRKTKEAFGGLSNMASGFPIVINNTNILSSEALYQALRFPLLPELQRKIINEKSPMSAKMVSKPYRLTNSREDWDSVRVEIMYWCLKIKLAQNFESFGKLLESTGDKPIVEDSNKDRFWGAVKEKDDETSLRGVNALGRLLMKLREEYYSDSRYDLLKVEPLNISNFLLFEKPIEIVDERPKFLFMLSKKWNLQFDNYSYQKDISLPTNSNVLKEPKAVKQKGKKIKRKVSVNNIIQTELPF